MFIRKVFSFATVTLLVALALSSIAAFYSVKGLTAIFAAAVIPIMIMGGSLEVAKVVTTIWLHRYWKRSGIALKLYLVPAVIALAFLTSMGIFGFLSKAHSDQSLVSGDVGAKVAIYDEKIKTAKDNIDANRKALQQMDAQVDQLLGRTTDDKGANRAVQVRRQQKAERTRLQNEIAAEQQTIQKIQEEAAPIRASVRKVEAEVGPIKYIAALIYGDNPDTNLLERAVRWVIILIVFVFDPLALTLVLAAQSSYKWLAEDLAKKDDITVSEIIPLNTTNAMSDVEESKTQEPEEAEANDEDIQQDTVEPDVDDREIVFPAPDPIADETVHELDTVEDEVAEPVKRVEKEIKTEGITLEASEGGTHVIYGGKSVSKSALMQLNPQLFASIDDLSKSDTGFGIDFPKIAKKGDMFIRVDTLPNRVFKFDGSKWIEINKETSTSYLYDEEYIRYLIKKIESGEYDIDLLNENEKSQIEDYLQSQTK